MWLVCGMGVPKQMPHLNPLLCSVDIRTGRGVYFSIVSLSRSMLFEISILGNMGNV